MPPFYPQPRHHDYLSHIKGEELPDWKDLPSMFRKRTLCSDKDPEKPAPYATLNECVTRLYAHFKLMCPKVLHMGRRVGQQELADAGIAMDTIKRWCKYVFDEQSLSYILHIQIEPMLQRAGYDYRCPEAMHAAHLTVDTSHIVHLLVPKLIEYENEVAQAFRRCKSFDDAKHECLFVARGMYRHMRLCFERLIQCAAARPRDEHGIIDMQQEPLYKQFAPHNGLFRPCFHPL